MQQTTPAALRSQLARRPTLLQLSQRMPARLEVGQPAPLRPAPERQRARVRARALQLLRPQAPPHLRLLVPVQLPRTQLCWATSVRRLVLLEWRCSDCNRFEVDRTPARLNTGRRRQSVRAVWIFEQGASLLESLIPLGRIISWRWVLDRVFRFNSRQISISLAIR